MGEKHSSVHILLDKEDYPLFKKKVEAWEILTILEVTKRVLIIITLSPGHNSNVNTLRIERGRYTKETGTWTRACRFCCNKENVQSFENLPFFEGTIIENEEHCLTECPMYHSARLSLSDNLKSLLLLKEYGAIMNSAHVQELGKFLCNCHRIRNPKKTPTLSVTPPGLPTQQT